MTGYCHKMTKSGFEQEKKLQEFNIQRYFADYLLHVQGKRMEDEFISRLILGVGEMWKLFFQGKPFFLFSSFLPCFHP